VSFRRFAMRFRKTRERFRVPRGPFAEIRKWFREAHESFRRLRGPFIWLRRSVTELREWFHLGHGTVHGTPEMNSGRSGVGYGGRNRVFKLSPPSKAADKFSHRQTPIGTDVMGVRRLQSFERPLVSGRRVLGRQECLPRWGI